MKTTTQTTGRAGMSKGCKAMAERIVHAEDAFLDTLMALGGIERAAAVRVFAYYRKNRIAKVDAVNGRVDVTHGAFLDGDTIRKAAAM